MGLNDATGARLSRTLGAIILAAGASLGWTNAASAVPYTRAAYEPFDYPVSSDPTDTQGRTYSGGSDFDGGWGGISPQAFKAGSLAYPGVTGQGNRLTFDAAANNGASVESFRHFGPLVDSGTFYFSFLARRNNTTDRTFSLAFYSRPGAQKFSVGQIGESGTSGNGNFALKYLASAAIVGTNPVAIVTGQTHLVVGRVDFDVAGTSERVRLYIDPVATGGEPATPYLDSIAYDLGAFDQIRLFAGGTQTVGLPMNAVSADFDEIRLGNTYASVVPEPGAAGLLGAAVVAVAGMRRRRQLPRRS